MKNRIHHPLVDQEISLLKQICNKTIFPMTEIMSKTPSSWRLSVELLLLKKRFSHRFVLSLENYEPKEGPDHTTENPTYQLYKIGTHLGGFHQRDSERISSEAGKNCVNMRGCLIQDGEWTRTDASVWEFVRRLDSECLAVGRLNVWYSEVFRMTFGVNIRCLFC